jgi:pimeloyl-ACP methyl ester carboxylesterase
MRFLLVHGGWQGGWCWDGVSAHLQARGHDTHAPTLRGLEPGDVDRSGIGLVEITRTLAEQVENDDLRDLVVVGHSGGGPVMQGLYELVPHRIARLVFVDAWVLEDGQCVYDVLPKDFADSLRAAADATPDRAIPMPPDLWRGGLMNDVDPSEADSWLAQVVPCPEGWLSEPISLPTFAGAPVASSYVFLDQDLAVPREVYEANAARLADPRTTRSPGSHEAMLSRPKELAEALLRVSE